MREFQIDDSSKVLVLEDDFLERVGWFRSHMPQATIVRNPQIAVQALNGREFDTVFLDFNVPCPAKFDGVHVARHLVESGFTGKVVVHSANVFGAWRIGKILRTAGISTAVAEFGDFSINGAPEPAVFDLGDLDA